MTIESINDPNNKISNALRYITSAAQEYFLDPIYLVIFYIQAIFYRIYTLWPSPVFLTKLFRLFFRKIDFIVKF
jgi:hypothetical protein